MEGGDGGGGRWEVEMGGGAGGSSWLHAAWKTPGIGHFAPPPLPSVTFKLLCCVVVQGKLPWARFEEESHGACDVLPSGPEEQREQNVVIILRRGTPRLPIPFFCWMRSLATVSDQNTRKKSPGFNPAAAKELGSFVGGGTEMDSIPQFPGEHEERIGMEPSAL